MKDPLHSKSTPYELLGIQPAASRADIQAAFTQAIAAGKKVHEADQSFGTLTNAEKRAMVDLFMYDDDFLGELFPAAGGLSDAFLRGREETARKLTQINTAHFPNWPALHCLAVLWYWWALLVEEQQADAQGAATILDLGGNLPPDTLWENCIATIVAVVSSQPFWTLWLGKRSYMTADQVQDVRRMVEKTFLTLFSNYAEKYRGMGQRDAADRLLKYEAMFSAELRTAQRLSKAGISVKVQMGQVPVCFGRLFMEQCGVLDAVRQELAQGLRQKPHDRELKELIEGLSAGSSIKKLVELGQYDEALVMIGKMAPAERNTAENYTLMAEIYFEKGKQCLERDDPDQAFENWRRALGTSFLSDALKKEMSKLCIEKAIRLRNSDLEKAIALLESGLSVYDTVNIRLLLSELCCQAGEKYTKPVIDMVEVKETLPSGEDLERFQKGIQHLKRACTFGSEKAPGLLSTAERIQGKIASGYLKISDSSKTVIERAIKLAAESPSHETKGLEEAIRLIRGVLPQEPEERRPVLKTLLAQMENQLGEKYLKKGDKCMLIKLHDQALVFYRQAQGAFGESLAVQPDFEAARANLAMVKDRLDKIENRDIQAVPELIETTKPRSDSTMMEVLQKGKAQKSRRAGKSLLSVVMFALQNIGWLAVFVFCLLTL